MEGMTPEMLAELQAMQARAGRRPGPQALAGTSSARASSSSLTAPPQQPKPGANAPGFFMSSWGRCPAGVGATFRLHPAQQSFQPFSTFRLHPVPTPTGTGVGATFSTFRSTQCSVPGAAVRTATPRSTPTSRALWRPPVPRRKGRVTAGGFIDTLFDVVEVPCRGFAMDGPSHRTPLVLCSIKLGTHHVSCASGSVLNQAWDAPRLLRLWPPGAWSASSPPANSPRGYFQPLRNRWQLGRPMGSASSGRVTSIPFQPVKRSPDEQ